MSVHGSLTKLNYHSSFSKVLLEQRLYPLNKRTNDLAFIAFEEMTGEMELYYNYGRIKPLAYAGSLVSGEFHGSGTLYYPDGTVWSSGKWENNRLVSGVVYRMDGSVVHSGRFKDGLPIR